MEVFDPMALFAFAQPPPDGTQPNPTAQMLQLLGTFGLMAVMLYFVIIRPQQKKAREHDALVKSLKPGDRVLTSGGVLGVVLSVKEKSVAIRSADTKLEILKSAVTEITDRSSSATQS